MKTAGTRLNIGILCSFFPPKRGGMATWMEQIAGLLASAGHQVIVYPFMRDPNWSAGSGYTVQPLRTTTDDDLLLRSRLRQLERWGGLLLQILFGSERWGGHDLLVCDASLAMAAAKWVRAWRGRPYVLVVGGRTLSSGRPGHFRGLYRVFVRRAMATAAAVVVDGEDLKSALVEEGVRENSIRVLPCGVDTTRFHPGADPAAFRKWMVERGIDVPDGVPIVLFVGRLSYENGPGLFLDVIARLNEPVHGLLVGDGPMRAELARRISEEDLPVTFLGDVPDYLLPAVYGSATVCLFPLRPEVAGVSIVALEAMACGRAVVTTAVGSMAEPVSDGETGRLVGPDKVDALVNAVSEILTDRDFRLFMGQKAREAVLAHWSAAAGAVDVCQLIESLART